MSPYLLTSRKIRLIHLQDFLTVGVVPETLGKAIGIFFFFSADNFGFQQIKTIRDCRHSKSSNDMKNGLKHYINSESGTVEWQLC